MTENPPPQPPDGSSDPDERSPYPAYPPPDSSSPDSGAAPPPGGYPAPPPEGGYQPYPGPGGYDGHTPMEPRATTAMVLGIVGIVLGSPFCGFGAVIGPIALVLGRRSMRAIDASGGQFTGRGRAMTGFVLGIVTTVLLALYLVGLAIYVLDR